MKLPFKGSYPLTQGFGVNPQYYTQFLVKQPDGSTAPLKGHNGLDYGLPTGTEVMAPHNGRVIETAFDQNGYGNYIKIENSEMGSILAHLQKIDVVVGQEVLEGGHLGYSNNTGNSTGEHLHWGWYKFPRNRSNGYGGFEDQSSYIDTSNSQQPVSGKLHTDEEYQACMTDRNKFWEERDEVIKASEELKTQLKEKNDTLTGFAALGYASADDITKKISELNQTNLGLQTQLQQVLLRNQKLADLISEKEKEDSTAIDKGLDAQSKLSDVKQSLETIARELETKPEVEAILNKFDALKRLAQWGEKMLKKQENIDNSSKVQMNEQKINPLGLLLSLFGVEEGGVQK